MLIACDGIWNVMTSEQAIEFIKEHLQEAKSEDASDKTLLSDIASKVRIQLARATVHSPNLTHFHVLMIAFKDIRIFDVITS